MRLPDFLLERHLGRHEFTAAHILCASDPEPLRLPELLALADPEARALWDNLSLGYTEAPGHPLLRAEIARLYAGDDGGAALSPEQILTFAGAEEAIFVLMNVALGPGDHAVVVWPSYQSLHEVARAAGADVTLLPLERDAGWALDLDALRRAIRPTTRLIAVNFPHNPTGATLSRADLDALVAIAADASAILFSDEVYRLLELDPGARLPAAATLGPRCVSLGVLSKAFGLAGLRIGWIATADDALLRRAAAFKDYTSICNSAPSEILALIALRRKEALLERIHAILRDNLAHLDRSFAAMKGALEWTRPAGGTIAFPRLLGEASADAFCARLLDEEGVLLLPGSVFGDAWSAHFRIGFGRADLPLGLPRLERFLERRSARI